LFDLIAMGKEGFGQSLRRIDILGLVRDGITDRPNVSQGRVTFLSSVVAGAIEHLGETFAAWMQTKVAAAGIGHASQGRS
jgi:hypothetical protein